MGKTLYLECGTGIAGDMLVAALLDLGADESGLRDALASLPVDGFEIKITRKMAGALAACDFDVVLDEEHENHDHDMAWLYGYEQGHSGDTPRMAHHHHANRGDTPQMGSEASEFDSHSSHLGNIPPVDHHHHHHHDHRGLAECIAIIDGSALSQGAKAIAKRTFDILAEAEAKAHGSTKDEVHFHEVGAIDSIVDIAAAAYCLDNLDITDVIVSPLAEGEGHVRTAHGLIPIPVPAVMNICTAHGIALAPTGRKGELVTPTGAALVAATRTRAALPASYIVTAVGYGAGKRAYEIPSVVRAMIIEDAAASADPFSGPSDLWKLETEVDDCTGEALGHVIDRLLRAGAREAHFLPCYMKKNRPGYQLEVLCGSADIPVLEQIIFEDTTTIGIRRCPMERTALPREEVSVETPYGTALAKRVVMPNGEVRTYPEYTSVAALARVADAGYQTVYQAVIAAIQG